MDSVCFERPTFNMYMFLLVCIVGYLLYFRLSQTETTDMSKETLLQSLLEAKDELYRSKLAEQQANNQANSNTNTNIESRLLNKIHNPLISPETIYPQGRLNSRGFDANRQFQMVGFLSGGVGEQYPVMGRLHDNRSDKYEYFCINEGRNHIKIPLKTKNYNELYDGDTLTVPQLSTQPLTFTKYEIENVRYNPNY